MENNEKHTTICPTCNAEYPRESDQAKMIRDCGECHSCDHIRGEQYDDVPQNDDDCLFGPDCHCDDCETQHI